MLEIIKRRRSVRNYLAEQIKEEELKAILEAAIYSPSGHNCQPWHFTVIQNKMLIDHISDLTKKTMTKSTIEKVHKLGNAENYHVFHHAPTIVIVSGNKEVHSAIELPGHNIPPYTPLAECSAAIQNMLLAAESLDIGSCWVGFVNYFFTLPEELAKLEIPANFKPLFAVCLGYKNIAAPVLVPQRNTECVNYIR